METLYEWNGYEARKFVYNFSMLEGWKRTNVVDFPPMDFIGKHLFTCLHYLGILGSWMAL